MKALNEKERESLWWQAFIGFTIGVLVVGIFIWELADAPNSMTDAQSSFLKKSNSIIHNQKEILKKVKVIDSLIGVIKASNEFEMAFTKATNENATLTKIDTSQSELLTTLQTSFTVRIEAQKKIKELNEQIIKSEENCKTKLEQQKLDFTKQNIANTLHGQ